MVVTATGMSTEMGRIATMLTSVTRSRSPLQRELDSLTKVLGVIAWGAVAFIVLVGWARGLPLDQLLLLGTAMAISAIPTGLPAFVSGLLSMGAKQLADARAVVKNLTDVETLGATSAINTDKTGTLTMNQMMVSIVYANGSWFDVEGEGYRKSGAIRSVAGTPVPDFTRLALGLVLDSDATVSDDGDVVGDPTEAALVVLAAKLGVDADETRRAYPRDAEVPFDSDYKFMATFHRVPVDGTERVIMLVKGGPDVVLARCSMSGGPMSGSQVPMAEAEPGITAANDRMAADGLRVLAFGARFVEDDELATMAERPMDLVHDVGFVGLVGMIDPLRSEAKAAVATALRAGIDVRMITGDNAVTAQAIGRYLGLGPGAISGPELQALSDDELVARLPQLHVFGRVSPEDKLRLARTMQQQGLIVAMTGDAVNDAAALKQADIGVAMGSGSEVTKQAARMILTDDNFGTLVHAVEIGRRVYDKVVSYVRYQMTQLLALVFLFLAATAFDINEGVALTPTMILYLLFFCTAAGVVVIAVDPGDPDVMTRPPRDPKLTITNRHAVFLWVLYAAVFFLAALDPAGVRPGRPVARQGLGVDDHDVRRDGTRHGLQRADEPPRPDQRPDRTVAQAARDRARARQRWSSSRPSCPGCRARCSPRSSPAASGSPASGWPCCCRSSSSRASGCAGAACTSPPQPSRWPTPSHPLGRGQQPRRLGHELVRPEAHEAEAVPEGAAAAARRARGDAGVGEADRREGVCGVRGPRHGRQGRHDQGDQGARQSRGSSGSSPCRRRRSANARRCTFSATCRTSPPRVRSSSSIAAGTTAPASSG